MNKKEVINLYKGTRVNFVEVHGSFIIYKTWDNKYLLSMVMHFCRHYHGIEDYDSLLTESQFDIQVNVNDKWRSGHKIWYQKYGETDGPIGEDRLWEFLCDVNNVEE